MPDTAAGLLTRDMDTRPLILPAVVPAVRPVMSRAVLPDLEAQSRTAGIARPDGTQAGFVGMDPTDSSTHVRKYNPMAGSAADFQRLHDDTRAAAAAGQGSSAHPAAKGKRGAVNKGKAARGTAGRASTTAGKPVRGGSAKAASGRGGARARTRARKHGGRR